MRRTAWGVALVAVFAALLAPCPAWAVTEPAVWTTGGIDYVNGTIALGARAEAPTVQLELWQDQTLLETAAADPATATVRFGPHGVRAQVTFRVVGKDAAGAVVWERAIGLDPADYRPSTPVLSNTVASKVVPSRWTFRGTARRPVTELRVRIRQTGAKKVYPQTANPSGEFSFSAENAFGPTTREIVAVNGFGKSAARVRRVFYLGTGLPSTKRYVVVSKKTLWMFHVYKDAVIRSWPIAIGTPQTPTPTGTFKIGRAQPPGAGDWGVLRRRLWRLKDGKLYKTRYFVHGTYQPWTIGMAASHGCVRMHNKHVREFKATVPTGTRIKIR